MTLIQFLRTIQRALFDTRPTLVANSFFNNSQLKPRIQMLINPETNRRSLWRYALMLPVAALLLMCSQKDTVDSALSPTNGKSSAKVGTAPAGTGEVFTVVEQNPVPKGGMASLGDYLEKNLRYPAAAQRANAQGKVFVSFIVNTDGRISDVQILKGIGFGCDAEAARVVSQMPNWTPGRQSGRAVNVRFNLPIRFELDESSTNAGSAPADGSLEKYTLFVIDGKAVDKATFMKAFGKNPKEISDEPSNKRISITTR